MPVAHDIVLYLADGGMNSKSPPERLPPVQYARGTNVAVVNQLLTTRYGTRVVPLSGDAASILAGSNFQGGMLYAPGAGQGAVSYGTDSSSLLFAVAGHKLQLTFSGRGLLSTGVLSDVSNGLFSDPDLHQSYLLQAENYAFAQDGQGDCWIWDGVNPATLSTGYVTTQTVGESQEGSRMPNGGTVMSYCMSVVNVAVNGRSVLSSDGLNSRDLTSASDLTFFRQQSYWATGQYFAPPTNLGAITAMAVLPVQDTLYGQGALMVHCQRGIFSINLNVAPRSAWSSTPMVQVTYAGSGATGPNAIDLLNGDQIFRSHVGVQTLQSVQATANFQGAPHLAISEPVGDLFASDSPRWLRFASVAVWNTMTRAFVTVQPIVQGRHRWHRGLVSRNFHAVPAGGVGTSTVGAYTTQAPPIWEGLWTFEPQTAGVIQQINGMFDSEERHFAVCRGTDGVNRLAEFRSELRCDILEDGSSQRIRSQVVTRAMDAPDPFTKKSFNSGRLFLSNVYGLVDWGVWYRFAGQTAWTCWRSGSVDNTPPATDGPDALIDMQPGTAAIDLGTIPNTPDSRFVQFLIRWAGYCSIQCLRLTYNEGDPDDDKFQADGLKVKYCARLPGDYSDFEYNLPEGESWLQTA